MLNTVMALWNSESWGKSAEDSKATFYIPFY